MADKIKATITVVRREGFLGFWSARRFFAQGQSLVELTAEEKRSIEADSALGLPIALAEGWPKTEAKADPKK
jgi:hypothetical protein